MRRLLLVLGAGGQLGEATVERLASRHEVVARTREDLDVTSVEAVDAAITSICPDAIINCAAYTHVDTAEIEPTRALAVNAWAVRSMARAARKIDAAFVHYSTDFVFDGTSDRPYTETDMPNPRGTYASSKLIGEWLAAETPRHYVLRVESLFGGKRTSSVDRLLTGILEGHEVRAFADRTVSPSYVGDVADATRALLEGGRPFGLYHCVGTGHTTWLNLARELASLAGRPDAAVTPIAMADSGLPVARPQFAALSNAKLASVGIAVPTWQDALARYVTSVTPPAPQSPATP
jgi:dTDP-4-dehydrorhamnose reductase